MVMCSSPTVVSSPWAALRAVRIADMARKGQGQQLEAAGTEPLLWGHHGWAAHPLHPTWALGKVMPLNWANMQVSGCILGGVCLCCVEITISIVIVQPLSVIFTNCSSHKEFSLIKISAVWRQTWIYNHKIKWYIQNCYWKSLEEEDWCRILLWFLILYCCFTHPGWPCPWATLRGRIQGCRVCSQGCPTSIPNILPTSPHQTLGPSSLPADELRLLKRKC